MCSIGLVTFNASLDSNTCTHVYVTISKGKCVTYLSQVVGGVISLPLQVVIKHVPEDIMVFSLPQATAGPVLTDE